MLQLIKNKIGQLVLPGVLLCSLLVPGAVSSQVKYQSTGGVKITIEGTSNIHDWEMNSDKGACTAVFTFNTNGNLTGLSLLGFSVAAESLKSEHKAMDKNTYKAMNTDKYPTISFALTSSIVQSSSGNNYVLKTKGKLTISGVTKDIDLTGTCTYNPADKSITCSGAYPLKMTDYGVTPPSIMFGTIKTGNAINVKFNFTLKTQ
jgi:polyisoprenoid-binding protein YceI